MIFPEVISPPPATKLGLQQLRVKGLKKRRREGSEFNEISIKVSVETKRQIFSIIGEQGLPDNWSVEAVST